MKWWNIINIQNTININQYQSQPIHNQFTRQHPEVFLKKVHPLMTSRPEIGVDLQPRPTPGSCKACMRLKISAIYIYIYIQIYRFVWKFMHILIIFPCVLCICGLSDGRNSFDHEWAGSRALSKSTMPAQQARPVDVVAWWIAVSKSWHRSLFVIGPRIESLVMSLSHFGRTRVCCRRKIHRCGLSWIICHINQVKNRN